MLSKKDRETVEAQVESATGEIMEGYVESYITNDDLICIREKKYLPALFIKDSNMKEDGTFSEVHPLLFTPQQISKAALLAQQMKAEGELDNITFLCVMNPSEAAAISKEEEEQAVVNLVMEHYSTKQLFKLFLLSLLK